MKGLYLIVLFVLCNTVKSDVIGYLENIGTYFGYSKQTDNTETEILDQKVPYEVSVSDEKFISEAAKLTGIVLSELDFCQHRVVLKLQTSCDHLNDEQLAKMAVMLLNCQSAVEGRKIYPCTDEMSIKDCTSSMDGDVWNSYHLISNRARAVCYSLRQVQFRGLTERTINRLMGAAYDQLKSLDKISKDQANLHTIAIESLESVALGQEQLKNQQKDLEMAQLHGQLTMENNIKRLLHEKQIILETHEQLTHMSQIVQAKLQDAAEQLKAQAADSRVNHHEILDDLIAIQNKAQIIFQKIDDSSNLLLKQNELARTQYADTVKQLAHMNVTVHTLVDIVGSTRRALEDRLSWLNSTMGGTELALERLYAITWHVGYLLLAMIGCAFLGVSTTTRFIVASFPPLNLVLTLQKYAYALNAIELTITLAILITVHTVIAYTFKMKQNSFLSLWFKQKESSQNPKLKDNISNAYVTSTNLPSVTNYEKYQNKGYLSINGNEQILLGDTDSLIFPSSSTRNGCRVSRSRSRTPVTPNRLIRGTCSAKTRVGSLCKLPALSNRDFCYRHQTGESVYGD